MSFRGCLGSLWLRRRLGGLLGLGLCHRGFLCLGGRSWRNRLVEVYLAHCLKLGHDILGDNRLDLLYFARSGWCLLLLFLLLPMGDKFVGFGTQKLIRAKLFPDNLIGIVRDLGIEVRLHSEALLVEIVYNCLQTYIEFLKYFVQSYSHIFILSQILH